MNFLELTRSDKHTTNTTCLLIAEQRHWNDETEISAICEQFD